MDKILTFSRKCQIFYFVNKKKAFLLHVVTYRPIYFDKNKKSA